MKLFGENPCAGDVFFRLPGLCHPKTAEFHGMDLRAQGPGFCGLILVMELIFDGILLFYLYKVGLYQL